jgi:hypothetical protein
MIEFLPKILVATAVAIAFALLRKYMPASGSAELPRAVSTEELDSRFGSVQWMIGFGMIVVGIAFAWITHKWLVGLNQFFAASEGPAYFRLLPSSAIWWFFPGFGAITLTWEITLTIWAMFAARETVDLYIKWTNLKAGFNSTKALRWMALLIAMPIGVVTVLASPMHTTIHADEMRIRRYASSSSLRYSYKDARWIAIVSGFRERSGKFDPRAEILVEFADGYKWSSVTNRDFIPTLDQNLANFLMARINLPVHYAETESDLHIGQIH